MSSWQYPAVHRPGRGERSAWGRGERSAQAHSCCLLANGAADGEAQGKEHFIWSQDVGLPWRCGAGVLNLF